MSSDVEGTEGATITNMPKPEALSARSPDERGAALVEFALVVGLVVLLLGGIVTYGVLLSYRQVLTQGATDGARAAAIAVDDPLTTIDERVEAARAAIDASLGAVDRTCTPGGDKGLTCQAVIIPCPNDAARSCAHVLLSHDNAGDPVIPPIFLAGLSPDTVSVTAEALVTESAP